MRTILMLTAAAAALVACGAKTPSTAEAPAPAAPEVSAAEAAPTVTQAAVAATPPDAGAVTEPQGNARIFVDAAGVAINGYDPVSFFKGAPAPGDAAFVSVVNGATFRFVSASNKAEFDADPAAFEPQFGGYCAYGAAKGAKFATKPETGAIVDGRLYFNKDLGVQKLWNKDRAALIVEANNTWPTIIDADPAR